MYLRIDVLYMFQFCLLSHIFCFAHDTNTIVGQRLLFLILATNAPTNKLKYK